MRSDFYGLSIDTPLSIALNAPEWENSRLGLLGKKTQKAVYIQELEGREVDAQFSWRVVDAHFSTEDSQMTYLRAFDLGGHCIPQASFGINWGTNPHRISGGFDYKPRYGIQLEKLGDIEKFPYQNPKGGRKTEKYKPVG